MWYNVMYTFLCGRVHHGGTCVKQKPFLSGCGKKRFLDSKERQPEEVSSGLHVHVGSLREKPWSPLKQWGVVWEYRIPLVRCTVLLTNFVPRNQPAARRLRPRQRRERKRSLPRTAARPNYSFSDRTSETHDIRERYARKKTMISASGGPFLSYTGRGAFFLFGQEPKRKNGGRNEQVMYDEQGSNIDPSHIISRCCRVFPRRARMCGRALLRRSRSALRPAKSAGRETGRSLSNKAPAPCPPGAAPRPRPW